MATIEDLIGWITEDLNRFGPIDACVEVLKDVTMTAGLSGHAERSLVIQLYTATNRYRISAAEVISPAPQNAPGSYLGASASARQPRAGEEHTRGRDLHDGPLTRETWTRILADLVSFELVRVHGNRVGLSTHATRPPRPMPPGLATRLADPVMPVPPAPAPVAGYTPPAFPAAMWPTITGISTDAIRDDGNGVYSFASTGGAPPASSE